MRIRSAIHEADKARQTVDELSVGVIACTSIVAARVPRIAQGLKISQTRSFSACLHEKIYIFVCSFVCYVSPGLSRAQRCKPLPGRPCRVCSCGNLFVRNCSADTLLPFETECRPGAARAEDLRQGLVAPKGRASAPPPLAALVMAARASPPQTSRKNWTFQNEHGKQLGGRQSIS